MARGKSDEADPLAKSTGEALLFKGNDFSHTDITPALPTAAG
jgi:uncharacterized protein with PIN domain